jgi:hypothetical protein
MSPLIPSLLLLLLPSLLAVSPDREDSLLNRPGGNLDLSLVAEMGALLPLAHEIQFSKNGTLLDYVDEGGQDNLFLFKRLSAELDLGDRQTLVFLYQPLDLRTQTVLAQSQLIDNALFPAGSPLDLRYGFDFYRASWLWDLQEAPRKEFALGASLQIRNASIEFTSGDGKLRRVNHDIGPVPILKVRVRQPLGQESFWGFEADGFYAPIKYINGSNTDVVGSILDTSLRVGTPLSHGGEAFLNLRYLGGGAEGTSKNLDGPGDGWVSNWLHFTSLSLGFALR